MSEIYQLPENNSGNNDTIPFPFQSALAVMVMDLVMDLAVSTALRICSDLQSSPQCSDGVVHFHQLQAERIF